MSGSLSPGSDTSKPPTMDVVGPGGVGAAVAGTCNVNSFGPTAGKEAAGADTGVAVGSGPPSSVVYGNGVGTGVDSYSHGSPSLCSGIAALVAGSAGNLCGLVDGLGTGSDIPKPPAMDMVGPGGVGAAVAGSVDVFSFLPPAGKEAVGADTGVAVGSDPPSSVVYGNGVGTGVDSYSHGSPSLCSGIAALVAGSAGNPCGLVDGFGTGSDIPKPPAMDMVGPGGVGAAVTGSVDVFSFLPPAGKDAVGADTGVAVGSDPPSSVVVGNGACAGTGSSSLGSPALCSGAVRLIVGSADTPCGLVEGLSTGSDTSKPPAVDMIGPGGVGAAVVGSIDAVSFRPSVDRVAAGTDTDVAIGTDPPSSVVVGCGAGTGVDSNSLGSPALCCGVTSLVAGSSGFVAGLVTESPSGSADRPIPPASGVVGSGVGSIGCGVDADNDTSSDVLGAGGVCGVCGLLADNAAWCMSDAPLALRASAVQTTTMG